MLTAQLREATEAWPVISRVISVPHTPAEYARAIEILDQLVDEVGGDEQHPLASLMETLGTLIEDYEKDRLPEQVGDPVLCLRHLMGEHQLRQSDLPEIGPQSVVSEILSGKRKLNVRQIHRLAKRFHVSPAVFV